MFFSEQQFCNDIFDPNLNNFDQLCLHAFRHQYKNNKIYNKYCNYIGIPDASLIISARQIPFIPVAFFKTQKLVSSVQPEQAIFSSSATGGLGQSKHYVMDVSLYKKSFVNCFERKFGSVKNYCIVALLPSYLEREGSSLIYMVEHLMSLSAHPLNGFFLYEHQTLKHRIEQLEALQQPYILFGVSFALLDFIEKESIQMHAGKIIETGGMKGRKKEITKMEVYTTLQQGFNTSEVYSEYGMTELLSQAYASNDGWYTSAPWMKVSISDPNDPFVFLGSGKTGLINVTDLANINSCCFIQTSDLGRLNDYGQFEVLGRIDNSDLRGCSLMV